jgi:ubiquinone/menaquinone biosynthesis C-methylase UbiE
MSKNINSEQDSKCDEHKLGIPWLLDHHIAKEEQRHKMVEDLNLKSGEIVLDLGCGPGLWTHMLAEKVKPDGRIIGLDSNRAFLNYALKNNKKGQFKKIVEFHEGNFYSLPFEKETFDLVLFGNCISYVKEYQKVLKEQKRVTKKGGRIAVRDFEGSVLVIHPIEPLLTMKVLTAAAQALKDNPPDPFFDNFPGQKLRGHLVKAGLKKISCFSYAVHALPPLTSEEKRYIIGWLKWYSDKGKAYLSTEDLEQWLAYFDPCSDEYILDSDEFYFCALDIMAIGEV